MGLTVASPALIEQAIANTVKEVGALKFRLERIEHLEPSAPAADREECLVDLRAAVTRVQALQLVKHTPVFETVVYLREKMFDYREKAKTNPAYARRTMEGNR